jgi:uncharacterized phiE125 gp8 family phage protein
MQTTWLHRRATDSADSLTAIRRHQFRYDNGTDPAAEPVTLAEAKLFARIDGTDDDALVTSLITRARQTVENQTGRILVDRTFTATLDYLPCAGVYELAYRPIGSVTSIKGINEDGTETTLDVNDDIILDGDNARITVKSTAPSLSSDRLANAFEIVYVAGYGATADDVPEWAKQAVLTLVATWYEHREQVVVGSSVAQLPLGVKLILDENAVAEI